MFLTCLLIFIPSITGIIVFGSIKPKYLRSLVYLMILTFLMESNASLHVYFKIGNINLNILYNIFFFADVSVWSYLFYNVFKSRKISFFIIFMYVLVILVGIFEAYHNGSLKTHITYSRRVNCLLLIFYSMYYLLDSLKIPYEDIFRVPLFYLCSACILYQGIFFVNLTTMAETNYWKIAGTAEIFYILQFFANSLYYILLCGVFLTCYFNHRQMRTPSCPASS